MKESNFYLNKSYIILVILLPVSLLISSGAAEIVGILIAIIFLIRSFYNNNFYWLKNKYCWMLGLIWLSLLLNLLFTQNFNLSSVRNFFFFKNIILVFSLIFIFKKEKNLHLAFSLYLVIISIVCFDIFFEYINGKNILGYSSDYEGRIASFLGKELKIAHFVLGFGFISLSYYFEKTKKKSIYFLITGYFIFLIIITSIVLTGEKANILRCLIFVILFIILSNKKIIKFKKIIISIFALLLLGIYFFSAPIKIKINTIINPIIKKELIETFINSQHGAHADAAIKIFKRYPYFGVGNKNFREECSKKEYYNPVFSKTEQRCSTHPHQIYLELLSEHGAIGSMTILGVIFYIIYLSFNIYFKNKNLIHLSSILFVTIVFLPLIPSGSFFTSWAAYIFWLNFSLMIFYNLKNTTKYLEKY
jgi:hypothetical protein